MTRGEALLGRYAISAGRLKIRLLYPEMDTIVMPAVLKDLRMQNRVWQ